MTPKLRQIITGNDCLCVTFYANCFSSLWKKEVGKIQRKKLFYDIFDIQQHSVFPPSRHFCFNIATICIFARKAADLLLYRGPLFQKQNNRFIDVQIEWLFWNNPEKYSYSGIGSIERNLRENFVPNCHTSTGARLHGYATHRTTCSFHGTNRDALLLQHAVTDA